MVVRTCSQSGLPQYYRLTRDNLSSLWSNISMRVRKNLKLPTTRRVKLSGRRSPNRLPRMDSFREINGTLVPVAFTNWCDSSGVTPQQLLSGLAQEWADHPPENALIIVRVLSDVAEASQAVFPFLG